jgi:release factor glutamine methyltransferase
VSVELPDGLTPQESFQWARGVLAARDPDGAALDTRLFLLEALERRDSSILLQANVPLTAMQTATFAGFVQRRLAGEPAAYILGRKEFWSLTFSVSPAVLIPRPDSETLVRAALDLCPSPDHPYTVLDLGVGSGCLLLSVLSERPAATGLGVDASPTALEIARKNAETLGFLQRARFALGDWGAGLAERFDLVLCNPPYIAAGELSGLELDVVGFEPHQALSPGADGLAAYARIAPQLLGLLASEGVAIFETGLGQAVDVARLLAAQGLEIIDIRNDYGGVARAVLARVKNSL